MSMLHLLAALMPSGSLRQKGYGHVYDAGETADLAMSYANVDGGIAPAAGDVVAWLVMTNGTLADLSGSGWAQNSAQNFIWAGIYAKQVVAGDISSPPQVASSPSTGSIAFWVAYTVVGGIPTISVPTPNVQFGGGSAPSDQSVDSSALIAPSVAIMLGAGGGDDGGPNIAKTGAPADITFTSSANLWLGNVAETQFIANAIVGGESATYSKTDDGGANHLASGYVSVTF